MRRTEHLSGGVAWPARDLYLADDGECPACRRTFDGGDEVRVIQLVADSSSWCGKGISLRLELSLSLAAYPNPQGS